MSNTATEYEAPLIVELFKLWQEFQKLNWKEVMYAPWNSSVQLELIEPGSTGIHLGYRDEQGNFWIVDEMGANPSLPIFFRLISEKVN